MHKKRKFADREYIFDSGDFCVRFDFEVTIRESERF